MAMNSESDQDSSILGCRDIVAISISGDHDEPQLTPHQHTTEFRSYRGILYLLYVGALIVMYPSLTQLVQLKFQNNKQSPFETLHFFANTAVVAYIIAIPISMVLFYIRTRHETSIAEHLYPMYNVYMILKSVFCFFGILAPLSLVLVLLLPHKSNWIGYLTIFTLFVVIVAYYLSDYKKIKCKKNVSNLELSKREEIIKQ